MDIDHTHWSSPIHKVESNMTLSIKDIPKENIFGIGVIQQSTQNDGYHFANARRPFVINRSEALNVIGYLIAHGDLQPDEIDNSVKNPEPDPFKVAGDNARVMIRAPKTLFIITPDEGLILIGALIRVMGMAPSEIDAAVAAITEQALGQTRADVAKQFH